MRKHIGNFIVSLYIASNFVLREYSGNILTGSKALDKYGRSMYCTNMSFWNGVKKNLNHGVKFSKEVLSGAGKKTKELKDLGILRLELRDLQSKRNKLYIDLGKAVCEVFADSKRQSISRTTAVVKRYLTEISQYDQQIIAKEQQLNSSQD